MVWVELVKLNSRECIFICKKKFTKTLFGLNARHIKLYQKIFGYLIMRLMNILFINLFINVFINLFINFIEEIKFELEWKYRRRNLQLFKSRRNKDIVLYLPQNKFQNVIITSRKSMWTRKNNKFKFFRWWFKVYFTSWRRI